MSFEFKCAHCGTLIEAQADQRGETSSCPACSEEFIIPLSDLVPGETFAGFTLLKMLGTGTFGQVFLGEHMETGQRVALKIIPDGGTSDDDTISERFMNEVAMMARITHPNVVPATKAGECGGYYFIAMDFIEGVNLEDRLETDGAMAEGEVLEIMLQVIDALTYAWESHKIIHRDIKPANIMLTPDGVVKVMDLGLSKSGYDGRDVLESTTSVVGTPFYMSPEQVRCEEIDWRTDQYSLGATMYHLLTGQPPFDGETCQDLMQVILDEDTPRASQHTPELSPGVDTLIGHLMQKDPSDRYDSWAQVLKAMRRVHEGIMPNPPMQMAHTATSDGIKRSRMRNAARTTAGGGTTTNLPVPSLAAGDDETGASSGVTRGVGRGTGNTTRMAAVPLAQNGKDIGGGTTSLPAAGSEKVKTESVPMTTWVLTGIAVVLLLVLAYLAYDYLV